MNVKLISVLNVKSNLIISGRHVLNSRKRNHIRNADFVKLTLEIPKLIIVVRELVN